MTTSSREQAHTEGRVLLEAIANGLPDEIDAQEAILSMRDGGSADWKQMEWIGFYPEFWFVQNLQSKVEAAHGPKFGNMSFDIERQFVWDLKAHSSNATKTSDWAPLNDVEAITDCIPKHDGVGFLVISGPCTYDSDGVFKDWHENLKGGPSEYSKKNAQRGAASRRRKTKFAPDHFVAFRFETISDIDRAQSEGWIKGFQNGMRNSNGKPRRQKLMVKLSGIGEWALVSEIRR